jgi:hypothetical protein
MMTSPDTEMVSRHIVIRAQDVVFLKGIIEAHDGIAQVYGERGGELIITAPKSRERELNELMDDLMRELSL